MSEESTPLPGASPTAGSLLRQARQAKGLHLAALAASLKIPPSRLDMIERDRWNELPDRAYARALAHTVCRALAIDPEPVLRALPQAEQPRLEQLGEGLDEPFREGSPTTWRAWGRRKLALAGVLLAGVLAAASWFVRDGSAGAAFAPAPASRVAVEPAAAPAAPTAMPPPGASAPSAGSLLRVRASQASWVEVLDGQGKPVLSRLLRDGEEVELPYAAPMTLTAGNAAATSVWLNGQVIDLSLATRDNVARLDLR